MRGHGHLYTLDCDSQMKTRVWKVRGTAQEIKFHEGMWNWVWFLYESWVGCMHLSSQGWGEVEKDGFLELTGQQPLLLFDSVRILIPQIKVDNTWRMTSRVCLWLYAHTLTQIKEWCRATVGKLLKQNLTVGLADCKAGAANFQDIKS